MEKLEESPPSYDAIDFSDMAGSVISSEPSDTCGRCFEKIARSRIRLNVIFADEDKGGLLVNAK